MFLCTGLVFFAVTESPAAAAPAPAIVHTHGGSLVQRQASATKPETIATLPVNLGHVSRIETSTTGAVLLVAGRDRVLHLDLTTKPPTSTVVECHGRASLSPNGRFIACALGKRGVELHRFGGKARPTRVPVAARLAEVRGADAELVVIHQGALWSFRGTSARRKLTPHAPDGEWLVAPSGLRAVGVYGANATGALYTFKLDGKGVKRRLLRDARPVAWSANSRWVLVQRRGSACIVRAVGGQYKCWKKYQALAITPDGSRALLSRTPKDAKLPALYVGELSGARPAPPKKILAPFQGAAAWRPRGARPLTRPSPAVRQ